jgi:aldose 1-epimerase
MLHLEAGQLICDIEPELGGCITSLRLGDVPVLRPSPPRPDTARQSSSYPLVPFSNRIGGGRLQWQGTLFPLVRGNAADPHAIHGVGWQRRWHVLESSESFAMLSYEHAGDGAWPFAFDCSQTFRVSEDALELTLSLTNQSNGPAPAGLGWHPFFLKRPGSRVRFNATGRWEMGEDKLPTHRSASQGLDAACAGLDVDHCFDGWDGVVELSDERLRTRIRSSLSRLVVFTNDSRDSIAIEPVSHVNNALAIAGEHGAPELGIVILQPGESVSASMSIEVRPA